MQWLLIDSKDVISNIIAYDGVSPYTPAEGFTLVQCPNGAIFSPGWLWNKGVPIAPTPSPVILSTDQYLAQVANTRYNCETGGCLIANTIGDGNNYIFPTDRDSQAKYIAMAVDIAMPTTNLQTFSVAWKLNANTFLSLNAPQMMNVILTVRDHVQAAFTQEAYYVNLICTANTSILQTTDFTQGWPSND